MLVTKDKITLEMFTFFPYPILSLQILIISTLIIFFLENRYNLFLWKIRLNFILTKYWKHLDFHPCQGYLFLSAFFPPLILPEILKLILFGVKQVFLHMKGNKALFIPSVLKSQISPFPSSDFLMQAEIKRYFEWFEPLNWIQNFMFN